MLAPSATAGSVTSNSVQLDGPKFGITVPGGCVYGEVSGGEVDVSAGGFVTEGGCLGVNGHA